MTTRSFSILIFLGTILSWINLIGVLLYIDPYQSKATGIIFFYLSISMALTGSLYLLGFIIRKRIAKYQPAFQKLRVAWRQAIWFTILIVVLVLLHQYGLLTAWNLALLLIILVVLEFFFISYKKEI